MRLSPKEKLVLETVLLQARHTAEQIARQTGLRSHVVRRLVDQLENKRVLLGVRAYVNPYPLGLHAYQVFFSLPGASIEQHNKLMAHLYHLEGVVLLSELGGDPQYEMHYLARSAEDSVAFLDSVQRAAPKVQLSSFALIHEQLYSGALGYLMKKSSTHLPLRYGATGETLTVDHVDHSLLCLLANQSTHANRSLAQQLKIPASTISYRMRSLEERGLIAGYYHLCDFKPLGLLPVVALISSPLLSEESRARLAKFCNHHPVIAYVDFTVGASSARVFMRAASYEEARRVMSELREAFSETILSIMIMPQLRFLKHSTYPFSPK